MNMMEQRSLFYDGPWKGRFMMSDRFLIQIHAIGEIEDAYPVYAPCMYMPTPEKFDAELRGFLAASDTYVYACMEGGRIVGMLVLREIVPKEAELLRISVFPAFQRTGIGTFMICEVFRVRSLSRLFAETDSEAAGFYRKCGFIVSLFLRTFPDGQAERFRCELVFNASTE